MPIVVENALEGWRSTVFGILSIIALCIPPVQNWLTTTTSLGVESILGLIAGLWMVLFSRQ